MYLEDSKGSSEGTTSLHEASPLIPMSIKRVGSHEAPVDILLQSLWVPRQMYIHL
jgi:hypothetical protein